MKRKWIGIMAALFGMVAYANAEQTVEITGNDSMQFNVKAIEVNAGEEIKLVFKNVGTLPKNVMGHNVVVLKPGSSVATFGNAAMTAAENEYIPKDPAVADAMITHTKLLGPGETDTITFTLEAGEYPFLCSFPGHYALMQGTIVAK